jgi:hypothetical protein
MDLERMQVRTFTDDFDPTKVGVIGMGDRWTGDPDWVPSSSDVPAPPWGAHFRNIYKGNLTSNWGNRPDLNGQGR